VAPCASSHELDPESNEATHDQQTRRLVAQLERLGHVVTLQEAAA
jgi:hypothetical protein